MKQLILMQGAPGCGKSTMAEILVDHYRNQGFTAGVYSADAYWYEVINPDQPEHYSWDTELSGQNHVWNQKRVYDAMQEGVEVIVVDNTNTLRKEAAPYVVLAQMFGYEVEAIRVDPGVDVCIARNSERTEDRKVPEEIVRAYHARMENLLPLFS